MRIKTAFAIFCTSVRFSASFSETFSLAVLFLGLLSLPFNRTRATGFLMRSHRATSRRPRQVMIEELLNRYGLLRRNIMRRHVNCQTPEPKLLGTRILKLKEKSESERGVLISMFDVFAELGDEYDFERILSDYHVVLEPSYSGYCSPEILQFLDFDQSRFVVQSSEEMDRDFLNRLGRNLLPIDIGSSDWVDERVFHNLNLEKEYDCIFLGTWSSIKRHYLLLEALRQIKNKSFRACLVGVPLGGCTRNDIEQMAAYYGVADQIDIHERITPSEVNVLLNKSRVNLLLTRKEGANRSIFEGLFANTPGLVLSENIGLNKNYINDKTGRLVDRRALAKTIVWFRENYTDFQPRAWALENISCHISTAKLEEKLKKAAGELGEPWTRSLAIKVNRPELQYYDDNVELTPFDPECYRKNTIECEG